MADKYFAIIRENPNKKWEYILTFSDDLDDLKAEIRSMQDSNDIAPNASIDYYKGEYLE